MTLIATGQDLSQFIAFIWTDCYLRECLQIEAEPGEYVISYELVNSPGATLRVKNMRVDYGPGTIKGTLLKILQ